MGELNRRLTRALKEKRPLVRHVAVGLDSDQAHPHQLRVWAEIKSKGGVLETQVCGYLPLPIELDVIYDEMERVAIQALCA